MEAKIANYQIRKIYTLASDLGLVNKEVEDDELHLLIYRETNKSSIKDLTFSDYSKVLKVLEAFKENISMTDKQKALVWRYMYRLVALDLSKGKAGVRLVGAIEKILNKSSVPIENPFQNLTKEEGKILIEQLKRYVKTEENKKLK